VVSELSGDEPDLQVGDSGEGVMLLQVRLYGLGMLQSVPDGTFNMETENAVRELQSARGLDNSGEVNWDTWEAIVYLEQQYGIQYQYQSPYDALSQIWYDREHPNEGGEYGRAGQAGYGEQSGQYGQGGYASQDDPNAPQGYAGQLSEDGQWRWDGADWQPAHAGGDAYASSGGSGQHSSHVGQLSEDGQWRWDGADWQAASAGGSGGAGGSDYVGQLSEDGNWRWDGTQWGAA
jgi:hypothetical protein